MLFETRDREYTAQILKRRTAGIITALHQWVPCGNTTFVVHEPVVKPPSMFDADAYTIRARIRVQMMYGAGLSRPKIPPLTF